MQCAIVRCSAVWLSSNHSHTREIDFASRPAGEQGRKKQRSHKQACSNLARSICRIQTRKLRLVLLPMRCIGRWCENMIATLLRVHIAWHIYSRHSNATSPRVPCDLQWSPILSKHRHCKAKGADCPVLKMCIFSFSSRFGAKGLSQNKKWEKKRSFRTVFAAESGEIRKNRTFSNLRGLNLCTSHILVFDCLHGQDVVGS